MKEGRKEGRGVQDSLPLNITKKECNQPEG